MRSPRALLILLAAAACSGGDGRTPVVVYSAHGPDILAEFERDYEAAHPGTDIVTVYKGSAEILDLLRASRDKPQAHVVWGADATALATAAKEGLLAPYRPSFGADAMAHDPAWLWTSCFSLPIVIGYQPKRISKEELPRTFAELGDPRFRGKLVLREPSQSGTMRTLIAALVAREGPGRETEGFDLLRRIHQNVRNYEGSPELMFEALEKGPAALTLWNLTDLVFQRLKHGYSFLPAALAEPVPVATDGVAVVARPDRVDAANDFVEFVNTQDALRRLATAHARIPTRPDFDPAGLLPAIRDTAVVPLAVDPALLAAKTAEWMRRFDDEVRGRAPASK